MNKILLVDDDLELLQIFKSYLEGEGLSVETATDGGAAVTKALSRQFDAVVLDVMMPVQSGIEALRQIRVHSNIPVLMLTAKGDDMDRILGLELGADDYVPKPCMPRELVARLRAILRRAQTTGTMQAPRAPVVAGKLTIYPERRQAESDGQLLNLTSTEFNLLEVLALNAGRPVSKKALCEQGLGRPLARFDRSIDVHISSLRQKIGTLSDGRSCIQTVIRVGYQLIRE